MLNRILGILVFTVVELITLVIWLILAGVPYQGHILAIIVLFIGLFIEHYFSVNVAAGRSLLGDVDKGVPRA